MSALAIPLPWYIPPLAGILFIAACVVVAKLVKG